LINFSEKLLTGSIGSASAKILIASVVKEEQISLVEVLRILEESKENIVSNKILVEKSDELSQLSSKLKDVNQELVDKDKQKDEFLDTVAHELKTPITGIRAAAELLMDDEDDMSKEIKNQFLTNILQDSDRLGRLINNILDFEKLETGRLRLDIKYLDIQQTIKKAVANTQHIAAKKGIKISIKNAYRFKINYDEDRIIQVLYNLISNAIKFCEPISGLIEVDYKLGNEVLEISIGDNGKGIPAEDIDYIFEKFYQSQHQNTIKPEGSGLGLAITKQIIEKHKGKIWVDKTIKTGAKFVFTIPIS
jgi:signal transduction histidine kinase